MSKTLFGMLGAGACLLLLAFPLAAADPAKPASPAKPKFVWPAETIAGSIMNVDPSQHLVIVKGPDSVPFDLVVNPGTHIQSDTGRLTLDQLKSDIGKSVSVRFLPERSGDIARSIEVKGAGGD